MKNSLIVVGFIVCALISFGLMVASKHMIHDFGEWDPAGPRMRQIEERSTGMIDKCRLDRMQGRIKGFEASVRCANPTIREAFAAASFPNMDKVDEFLAKRADYAKKADDKEITEDEMRQMTQDAQVMLLESVKPAEAKK